MNNFGKGVLAGVVGTVAAAIAAGVAFHEVAVKPVEEVEAKFDETEFKSARKAAHSHGSLY